MAKRKKSSDPRVDVSIRLPVPIWAFYEGVAAYAGVSVGDAINVVLSIAIVQKGASGKPTESGK